MMIVTGRSAKDDPKDAAALCRDRGDRAVQCCISEWNRLCPQYPLTNVTEVIHRKRWLFFGPDVCCLEQNGGCGQISRVTFGINRRLTARALRRQGNLPIIMLNCWICWNCGATQVRGWSNHIAIDVSRDCVVQFPHITPVTPHVYCCPLP